MAGKEGPAARRPRLDWRYTRTRRATFLRVLAETYDTEAALAAARLTWPDVCELRARHSDFAVRFEEVIAAGYDRMEALLLRRSGLGGGQIDVPLAQALLKQRRAAKAEAAAGATSRAARSAARSRRINNIMSGIQALQAGQPQGSKADAKGANGGRGDAAAGEHGRRVAG